MAKKLLLGFIFIATLALACAVGVGLSTVGTVERSSRPPIRNVKELERTPPGVRCFVMFNDNGYVYETLSCVPSPDAGAR